MSVVHQPVKDRVGDGGFADASCQWSTGIWEVASVERCP